VHAGAHARTVERGKIPEDGTGGECGTLSVPPRRLPVGAVVQGAPDVDAFVGARTSREAAPAGSRERAGLGNWAGPVKGRAGGEDAVELSQGSRTSREELAGPWFCRHARREKPRGRRNGEGDAPEANTALLGV